MTDDRGLYIELLETQLEEWNVGIDELQSRVDRAEADFQRRDQQCVDRLRRDHDAAVSRLSELRRCGPDEWERFREGMEEARSLLDRGIREARRDPED